MIRTFWKAGFSLALVFILSAVPGAYAQPLSSTLKDQQNVALTIYNSNVGLVKDLRALDLKKGIQELKFMDVAGKIDPTTVHIKSLVDGASLAVLEQNYEYDLLSPQKLLEKFVGQKVRLATTNPETKKEEIVEATLLSTQGGNIFQVGDKIHIGHPGRVVLPRIPENLIPQPTLVWLLDNKLPDKQKVEATYLTGGINWKADYVAILNAADTQTDLTGWVTIDNRSGATYQNAQLKLVAGDIHRVREERIVPRAAAKSRRARGGAAIQRRVFFRVSSLHAGSKNHGERQPDQADDASPGRIRFPSRSCFFFREARSITTTGTTRKRANRRWGCFWNSRTPRKIA